MTAKEIALLGDLHAAERKIRVLEDAQREMWRVLAALVAQAGGEARMLPNTIEALGENPEIGMYQDPESGEITLRTQADE